MDGPLQDAVVLIAHAAPEARRALRAVLEDAACAVAEAASADEAVAALADRRVDVVLLDHRMAAALPRIKGDPELFGVAVVLLGDPGDPDAALGALEHGAHDVLRDDPSPAEVVSRVRSARRAHEMQEQLLAREHDLEALAYRDELTGLANRRFALRQLGALISRARRHDQDVSVLLVDVDRFKALNDAHGHAAGDAVLRGLAGRLAERVRREDVVARFGGEEFIVLLPDTDTDGAPAVAEDLRAAVGAEPFEAGRLALPVTVSVGWATWRDEQPEQLLARADRALYAAKAAGRDRVESDEAARTR